MGWVFLPYKGSIEWDKSITDYFSLRPDKDMINEFKDLNSFKDEMKGWIEDPNKYDEDRVLGTFKKIKALYDSVFPTKADMIVQEVRQDLLSRSEVGIKKYGVTLDRKDLGLKEWLEHAYCECLDQALYLKRAIKEL